MKYLLTIILALFASIAISAQTFCYHSFTSSSGVRNKTYSVYNFGPWHGEDTDIVLNLNTDSIFIGARKLEIIDRPCSWIVKKIYKYTKMSCIDENLNKVEVKLFVYDNPSIPKRFVVSDENKSTRFVVIQTSPIEK